jgi:hypothetical protein
MEVACPCFDGVKTNTLGHHIVTSLTTNVKRSLIAYFTATHSLPFDHNEGFLFREITLAEYNFSGIIVFGSVKVICSCCG